MLKLVYRKFFLNKIWLRFAVLIFISIFLYEFVSMMDADEETVKLFLIFCLIVGGFTFLLLCCYIISSFRQIRALKKYLHQLPDLTRKRLDRDIQKCDRIGNLYFTSSHLFVLQLRGQAQQGILCIPYDEIQSVRIRPGQAPLLFLEICRTQEKPSHYVYVQTGAVPETVQKINEKIIALRDRLESLRPITDEQKKTEKREIINFQKRTLFNTGMPFLVADFAALMIFCSVILLAENSWNKVRAAAEPGRFGIAAKLSEQEIGHLLFWPGLLFYLVTFGISFLLLVGIFFFMRHRMEPEAGKTIEWRSRWKVTVFTLLCIAFILFMGLMYSSDVHTWKRLVEGFYLLVG